MMEQGVVLESVWVAVGFIIFVALVWRKAGAAVGGMLDKRSENISSDLKEATKLRDEALEELQTYRRLHREAAEEAKTILQSAEATADRIRETAEKNAIAAIKRREQQADAKIKAAEVSMVSELRERAAALTVATATEIITGKMDEKAGLALVDSAAVEIDKLA
jgi:F-type H+-transporting ATPase subunit b